MFGGPSTSSDILGIKFDLVFDSTILQFEGPAIEGTFLKFGGVNTILQANASPGDPDRLVVAITREGSVLGVQATASEEPVVTLTFRAVEVGETTVRFENTDVVDSNLATVPGITFIGPILVSVNGRR